MIKIYLVMKYYILVLSVHLCILLIVLSRYYYFSINLLARYSSIPIRRHFNDLKDVLHYLHETTNMSIFYSNESKSQLLGYTECKLSFKSTQNKITNQQIRSSNSLANLFIKSLSTSTFKKLLYKIGMCQSKDIDMKGSINEC